MSALVRGADRPTRDAVVRTVRAEINTRQHQTQTHLVEQTARMEKYYADLRAELAERIAKAIARGDEIDSLKLRQDALDREEALRLDDLGRKAKIRVQIKLVNLLHIKIPRLFIRTHITAKSISTIHPVLLTLTRDPLTEKTDALACRNCQRPTFELRVNRQGVLHCAECNPGKVNV
jgi:hypothetical protein